MGCTFACILLRRDFTLGLQARIPDARMLNLQPTEARQLLLSIFTLFLSRSPCPFLSLPNPFFSPFVSLQASLLGLQARIPDTRMLNLKPPEARQLLLSCSSLRDAHIVATAYGLNRLFEWVGYVLSFCTFFFQNLSFDSID